MGGWLGGKGERLLMDMDVGQKLLGTDLGEGYHLFRVLTHRHIPCDRL